MTKAATPCFTPRIPKICPRSLYTQRDTVGLRGSLGSRYYKHLNTLRQLAEVSSNILSKLIFASCVILRSRVSYYGIMHVVAEAGSVRASVSCYVEKMQQTFGHPSAGSGCLVESKRQETHSKRLFVARIEGQSAWARIYPIEIYTMKLGIGFTQETEKRGKQQK